MVNVSKQKNKLTTAEISILHYINPIFEAEKNFPNYLSIRCDGKEKEIVKKLLKENFIEYADLKDVLLKYSVAELKNFLKAKKLPVSGRKQDIIDRIINSCSENEFYEVFPCRYYKLSNSGLEIIRNNPKTEIQYGAVHIDVENIRNNINNYENFIDTKARNNDYIIGYKNFINVDLPFLTFGLEDNLNIKKLMVIFDIEGFRTEHAEFVFKKLYGNYIKAKYFYKTSKYLNSYKQIESHESNDYIKYICKVVSVDDSRVCEICRKMSEKTFPIEEAVIGVNCPPFNDCKNDYCRCILLIDADITVD